MKIYVVTKEIRSKYVDDRVEVLDVFDNILSARLLISKIIEMNFKDEDVYWENEDNVRVMMCIYFKISEKERTW